MITIIIIIKNNNNNNLFKILCPKSLVQKELAQKIFHQNPQQIQNTDRGKRTSQETYKLY